MHATKGIVEHTLYGVKFKKKYFGKEIIYKELCSYAKVLQHVCSKKFLHKRTVKDNVIELDRFVFHHVIIGLSFNLPHLIFIHFTPSIRSLYEEVIN